MKQKRYKTYIGVTLACLLIGLSAGCSRQSNDAAQLPAALQEVAGIDGKTWQPGGAITESGSGNFSRVMQTADRQERWLELAAGHQGKVAYQLTLPAAAAVEGQWRLQFLSTQGTARISVAALAADGRILASRGRVYTGMMPPVTAAEQWEDWRYRTNYQGGWLEETAAVSEWLGKNGEGAVAYRLTVEVGEGQHALLARWQLEAKPALALTLLPVVTAEQQVKQGETFTVAAQVVNRGSQTVQGAQLELVEPPAFGIIAQGEKQQQLPALASGESTVVGFTVRAQRPDSVNLGKAWPVQIRLAGGSALTVPVRVAATRPGHVWYVMTEDLEPIDAAGYPVAWGNQNGWLEPAEFMGQMVHKAEALDAIAEKYGAKWTHYIAWPAVRAAEWAAIQSSKPEWQQVVTAIKESVRRESAKGHEYGLHMHTDYDPAIAGNVLSYQPSLDGLWANHLRHGWAHSLPQEGHFNDAMSRSGTMYKYQRILEELEADAPQGQVLTARAGSFDFGNGSAEEAMSTRVYRQVGLWGSTDADGNAGGLTAGEYGQEVYLAAQDDINRPAADLAAAGLVEFRPTPKPPIFYDSQNAETLNAKTDGGMQEFLQNGQVRPGVHAIVGFTHAMFVMGDGGWQSTQGGQFQVLDDHLRYVSERYVQPGLLRFGTGSDLVRDYLDEYTPNLLAVYGARRTTPYGLSEYQIQLLGRDIPADGAHPQQVSVKYPLYLRDSAYYIRVLKNGVPIYSTTGLPTPYNDIVFTVDDRQAEYTLQVYHQPLIYKLSGAIRHWKQKIFAFKA